MSASLGHIREFDPKKDDWAIFICRLENYFTANAATDPVKKRAILLNSLNEDGFKLMFNLCMPSKPEEKDYDELVKLLTDHFKPTKSAFANRFKFYNAVKLANESVADWAARIRSLAAPCEFEAEAIDMVLRDRFVVGFEKGPVRDRLFEEGIDSKFADVVSIASTKMAASMDQMPQKKEAQPQKKPNKPDQAKGGNAGAQPKCMVCGKFGHQTSSCRLRELSCNVCNQQGHLAPVCPNKLAKKDAKKASK